MTYYYTLEKLFRTQIQTVIHTVTRQFNSSWKKKIKIWNFTTPMMSNSINFTALLYDIVSNFTTPMMLNSINFTAILYDSV